MLNGKLQVMGLNKTSDNYVIISEIDQNFSFLCRYQSKQPCRRSQNYQVQASQNLFLFLDKNPGTKIEIEVREQTCDRIYMKLFRKFM